MAGKLKGTIPPNQPGISTFIQKSTSSPSWKRPLNSPEVETLPVKRINMSESEAMSDRLPADLKLLYDSISKKLDERIDPLESKVNILFNEESMLPKHVENVAKIRLTQDRMETRLRQVERENEELKTKLTNMEDFLLEKSIVLTGIKEEKWEEPEPRCELVNRELANLLTGDTCDVKLNKA